MEGDHDERFEDLARRVREREEKETSENDELFRPMDAAERSALADGVFAALDAKAEKTAEVVPIAQAKKGKGSSSRFVIALVAAAVAAAAAFFFYLKTIQPQPIAAYELVVEGGNQETRGEPASPNAVIRLDPASRLSVVLRPEKPVSGAIGVRSFLVRDGKVLPWDAPAAVGRGGVVTVEGMAGALFEGVPEGTFDVVWVIGRAEALPTDEALARVVEKGKKLSSLSVSRLRVSFSRPRGALPGSGDSRSANAILFAGCASVRKGGLCELGPSRNLTFFVPEVFPVSVIVDVDGAVMEPKEKNSIRGGLRVTVNVPEGAKKIEVSSGGSRRSLSFMAATILPKNLGAAEAARKEGALAEALALVEPFLAEGVDAETRRGALRQKARIVMAMGREKEAAGLFREALVADRGAGRVSDEVDDTFALSYGLLFEEKTFGEVRDLLSGLESRLGECPEAGPKAAYYRGLLALELGDFRGTLSAFGAASEGAERLGLDAYRSAVLEQEAEVLAVLGRHDEARARLEKARAILADSADVCRRAQWLTNVGWIVSRSGRDLDEARRSLESALTTAREKCPAGLGNVLVNLALVEVEMGNPKEARRHLAEAKSAGALSRLSGWKRLIEARLSLAEGDAKGALAESEVLRDEGERTLSAELVYEGALGRAEALAALGRGRDARAAYAEAAKALSTWGERMPLGEGRATFFSTRQRGARQTIAFLLKEAEQGDEGAAREALDVARGSLAGFVQSFSLKSGMENLSPEARRRWEDAVSVYRRERAALEERVALRGPGLSGLEAERTALRGALDRALAELGPSPVQATARPIPRAGEALFVVHRLPEPDRYVGFVLADGGRTIVARRFEKTPVGASPEALASAWIEPFRSALSNTRRLRLVLPAELASADWQALPFEGAPLFERMDVVYSLDLPEPADPFSPKTEAPAALVISDPTEDLPGARGSADAVVSALEGRGLRVVRLSGAAATHEAVRHALEQKDVRLLHYAGHAMFEGPDGLEASLRLARRGRFSVADVMAAARVPDIVVLAGCDTARAGALGANAAAGLGLGQAFLLKGAKVVIASPRPMGDGLAEQISRLFYAEPVERDPVAALRAATRGIRRETPTEDWAVLRVLGG